MTRNDEDLRPLLDAWLDGDLGPEDEARVEAALCSSDALATHARDDALLADAIRAALEGDARRTDAVAGARRAAARWRAAALAAAGLLVAATAAIALLAAGGSGGAGPLDPGGPTIAAARPTFSAAPGVRLDVEEGAGVPVARLARGSVAVHAVSGPARVEVPAATIEVEGRADVLQMEDSPRAVLTVHSGAARVVLGSGRTERVAPGEPVLVERTAVTPLAVLVEAYRGNVPEEVEVDPFTEGGDPQQAIAELTEENRRLTLELETLKRREGMQPLTVRELIATVGEEVARHGRFDRKFWHVVYRNCRALMRMARGRKDEVLAAVHDLLLAPGRGAARTVFGLRLLGFLRDDAVVPVVRPFLDHEDVHVRRSAVEVLARRRDRELRGLLKEVFQRSNEDLEVRAGAAGGLVRLGDRKEPLAWLMSTYRREDVDRRARERILGRIMLAPVASWARFIQEVGTDLRGWQLRHVIDQLGTLGGPDAERTLETLATRIEDPELRDRAEQALVALRGL